VDISVVIPVHNEEDNITPLFEEIRGALDDAYDYEVIFVDDASTDHTAQTLKGLRSGFPRLRILQHAECCGQSTAIHSGVSAARADWIATLDGDGQNDPADLPKLLAVVRSPERADESLMVCGHRKNRQDTWLRRLSSRVANAVRSKLLGDQTPDTGCGLKVFRRDVFLELPFFDHMHRFFPALFIRQGGKVISVVVNHRHRSHGASKYGLHNRLWVGIVDLFGVMWLRSRSKHPVVSEIEP